MPTLVEADSAELRKVIPRPQLARFRQIWEGLKVGRVLGDRVLVRTVEPRTEMDRYEESGLVIPDDARDRNTPMASTGIIMKVGEEVSDLDLNEGTMVMFSQYAGDDYKIERVQFKVMETREIMCTLEAEEGKQLNELIAPVQ